VRAQQTQRFIVQNSYWALPGKAEEVFQWRIHARDVRERLGLLRGQVLRRDGNSKTASLADAKATSVPEFQEVQKHMTTLISRFERSGRRLRTHYRGRNSAPGYHCAGEHLVEGRGSYCLNIGGVQIDDAVTRVHCGA
jgi:hypothetical protein